MRICQASCQISICPRCPGRSPGWDSGVIMLCLLFLRRDIGVKMAKGSSGMTMTVYGPMSLHDYWLYLRMHIHAYIQIQMHMCIKYKRKWTRTSSTAQGGGGSFKNRKPIGEVGCCESRMAERSHWWTERWLRSLLFLSLSVSFSDHLPTYPPIYLCIHLSLSLSCSAVWCN